MPMGVRVTMTTILIAFALPSLVRSGSSSSLPHITDAKFIEDCVKSHNLNRSNVNPTAGDMRYMTWDAALAITARAWARKCVFKHNIYLNGKEKKVHPTFESLGENIWSGYPADSFSVGQAMQSWVDGELPAYVYDQNHCRRICGHYTQVVWATSYKVGCAVHRCPDGVDELSLTKGHDTAHFVCNYYPPGNYPTKPYKQGRACSGCGGEECERSLCRYGYWSPEWDPEKSRCGAFCQAVLVLRPLAALLTLASAYFIKRQCPNIFVYE
ncbi:GLIPR1-like protein 1 [Engraulis encrasicolus]|uniref:GLIPR1-like protein 1 n=1 Tax=Engraulis encrasicolus TaxID=184585 RepID=UPI002FD046EA